MLRVALPNKGQLSDPAREMLREAGYPAAHSARELVVQDPENDVEFFFLRPRDIAIYVASRPAYDVAIRLPARSSTLDAVPAGAANRNVDGAKPSSRRVSVWTPESSTRSSPVMPMSSCPLAT
jgi:hypothetical protein